MSKLTVTAEISTKDRYHTTLATAMMSVASQTYPIKKFVLYDDGEGKDLRKIEPFPQIMYAMEKRGIEWIVLYGHRKGQVLNHEHLLRTADTDLVWRLDDDDFADSTTLEKMVSHFSDQTVGAVSGKVWSAGMPMPDALCSPNKIELLRAKGNIQWTDFKSLIEVDHFYNTFVYRREAALKHGYPLNLSPVGHGEETLFTYGIKKAGYKLILDPDIIVWHLKASTGGIRTDFDKPQWFEEDERKTNAKLEEWGVNFVTEGKAAEGKMAVLNNGLGDHLMFRMILPEVKAKYGSNLLIAACYPEVFKDDDVKLISIADAKKMCDIEDYNIYKLCDQWGWKNSLVDAFRKLYL